jgi:hypothetical protein
VIISSSDFRKLKPGDEVIFHEPGRSRKEIVACFIGTDGSIIFAGGSSVGSSVPGVELTGKRMSGFPVSPIIHRFLSKRGMVSPSEKELHTRDRVLIFENDFQQVAEVTVALIDASRGMAFGVDGTPIRLGSNQVALSGFRADEGEISSIKTMLLLNDQPSTF